MTARRPFLIIGHRGVPNHAPENTIASFDKALALGFRHIELDAQLSSDGVAVVFHDDILDRTSNGCGPLWHCYRAWRRCQALRVGRSCWDYAAEAKKERGQPCGP